MTLALRAGQWQALLVISPLAAVILGAYLYALVRGARVIWRNTPWADTAADDLCGTIFASSALIGTGGLVIAWIAYAIHLWNLER